MVENTPTIEIVQEDERTGHWSYHVQVLDGARSYRHEVRLSWADYNLWSGGRVAPQCVVRAAFEFLLQREPASSILPRFDCSVIRRYFPEVDRELPPLIRPAAADGDG